MGSDKIKNVQIKLKKMFGRDVVGRFQDISKVQGFYSLGSITLDRDGIKAPKGRITEIYGPEGSGKTTLAINAIRAAQEQGELAAFIDLEGTFDANYAEALGVDVENLLYSSPNTGEEALEVVESLLRSGEVGIAVIDSVALLLPGKEAEGDYGDAQMGAQARLMSQGLRKLNPVVKENNTALIYINQLRSKIGVMFGCFHHDTLVNFSDGRSIPIGEVVKNKITGDVYSLNESTGMIETKPIIGWHYNGKVSNNEDFIHIETESIDGNGRFGFTATRHHKILTDRGWVMMNDININDKLISKYNKTISCNYEHRSFYEDFTLENKPLIIKKSVKILKIRNASDRQMRNKGKFDISISDNHNYMVGGKHNGVIVHNSPETTTGGNSLKFYASLRLDIRKSGAVIKDKEGVVTGEPKKVKVIKSKINDKTGHQYMFDIIHGEGIDVYKEIIDLGVEDGYLEKAGSWYSMDGTKIGQGTIQTKQFFRDNPEVFEELKERIVNNEVKYDAILNVAIKEGLFIKDGDKYKIDKKKLTRNEARIYIMENYKTFKHIEI